MKPDFKLPGIGVVAAMLFACCAGAAIAQSDDAQSDAARTAVADKAMELSGLSASETFEVEDGLPIMPADRILKRLLYRIGKTSAGNLNEWSRYAKPVSWDQLESQPRDYRFWVFHRTGAVHSIIPFRYGADNDDDLLKGFYVAYCKSESGEPYAVLTRSTCANWPLNETFSRPQPVAFSGFFYGYIAGEGENLKFEPRTKSQIEAAENEAAGNSKISRINDPAIPVFIANRLAWYPDTELESFNVDAAAVALAKRGVDIGQFDYVKKENSKPLGKRDSDCFFQMLGAVKSIGNEMPSIKSSFVDLMKQPIDSIGSAVAIQGRVRQCVPVKIQSEDVKLATGIDEYYQLTVFPNLNGQQIVVKNPNGEDQVFRRFPVTVCLTGLPGEMTAREMENQQVFLEGFFYRFWSYASQRSEQDGVAGQVSPLLIASQVEVIASSRGQLDLYLAALMLAILGALVGFGWYFNRKNHRVSSRTDALQKSELPEQIDTSNFETAD